MRSALSNPPLPRLYNAFSISMRPLVIAMLAAAAAQSQREPPISETNPYSADADVQQGRRLFDGRCAGCHGKGGTGARGSNLAQTALVHAANDAALFRVIRRGIPGTEMPSSALTTDREVWQLAAYVRSLGRQPMDMIAGNAMVGESLFRGKAGCLQCHTVGFEGGRMGPVLSGVGARRGAAYLRQTLLAPESRIPQDFGLVEVAAKDGTRVRGIRVNEDTQSIQLRDLSDKLHSFWKDELAKVAYLTSKTPMPSYTGLLNDAELNDLIAYLVTLRDIR
jgi:cytochrome c oxidase cbb3-type subunit 3